MVMSGKRCFSEETLTKGFLFLWCIHKLVPTGILKLQHSQVESSAWLLRAHYKAGNASVTHRTLSGHTPHTKVRAGQHKGNQLQNACPAGTMPVCSPGCLCQKQLPTHVLRKVVRTWPSEILLQVSLSLFLVWRPPPVPLPISFSNSYSLKAGAHPFSC